MSLRGNFDFRDMAFFLGISLLVLALRMTRAFLLRRRARRRKRHGKCSPCLAAPSPGRRGFPERKPDWVRRAMRHLHEQHPEWKHRKLADAFNLRYFADTGMSVGSTWTYEFLKALAYEALHKQQEWKHRVPDPEPRNRTWGVDTSCITDVAGMPHIVLGIVDHGSRLNMALRRLKRFNAWTLLGVLFLAFGEYGVPCQLRLDNHPVHRAKRFQTVMRWAGVQLRFTALASPWQNGRIERLFGTFKACLRSFRFSLRDLRQVDCSLDDFRFWYNAIRPHQHLGGRTPLQVWQGINPYRRVPRQARWFEGWGGRLRGWELRH
jgi:transposase InsO family protein